MPLPGGPADKFGNRFEAWWTLSELLRMVRRGNGCIRIEHPGYDKAEFTVHGQNLEFHQAKLRPSSGHWTLSSLGSAGVELLQEMARRLGGTEDSFVFVSNGAASELAELTDRARNAENTAEFYGQFANATIWQQALDRLHQYWSFDKLTTYKVLQRIFVRTIDEHLLRELVMDNARALFLENPDSVVDALRSYTADCVHKTVRRDELVQHLEDKGFKLRRILGRQDASQALLQISKRHEASVRRRLIGQQLVPTRAAASLADQIVKTGGASVLLGAAGSGKSACVLNTVEILRERGIPALAFRLDKFSELQSTWDLGRSLDLEESPVLVLAAVAEKSALIIDQLDVLSTMPSVEGSALDLVSDLLSEINGIAAKAEVCPVLVCREFDWKNDHRLRGLLSSNHSVVRAEQFAVEEVRAMLKSAGKDPNDYQSRQLELLRLPQNLSLYLQVSQGSSRKPAFQSAKDLLEGYWTFKRKVVAERAKEDHWLDTIQALCSEITDSQQLWVRREKLDHIPSKFIEQMTSEGVVVCESGKYSFGHESFFDYCFARLHVNQNKSLVEHLLRFEQHLFRRAQVRQVLSYLRDADQPRYAAELRALLGFPTVRGHLKDLSLALLGAVETPTQNEWEILSESLAPKFLQLKGGSNDVPPLSELAWSCFRRSVHWFEFVDQLGLIDVWIQSDSDLMQDAIVDLVRIHQRAFPDRAAALLEPFADCGERWPNRLEFVMQWSEPAASRRFFNLFLRLIDNGVLDRTRGPIAANSQFGDLLHGVAKCQPGWLAEAVAHLLRRRHIVAQLNPRAKPRNELFPDDQGLEPELRESAAADPAAFVRHLLPLTLDLADHYAYRNEMPPQPDSLWIGMSRGETQLTSGVFLEALEDALIRFAEHSSDEMSPILASLRSRKTATANFLLLSFYLGGAGRLADEAVDLLTRETWRFECGFMDSPYWTATELIKKISTYCSSARLAQLENAILQYLPPDELTAEGHKSVGRASFNLLSAIPAAVRTSRAQARYAELTRKFEQPISPPRGVVGGIVRSPISDEVAAIMTDQQWLSALAKYSFGGARRNTDDPLKGGARQLAGTLERAVQKSPQRFARLILQLPPDSNSAYLAHTLSGLRDADIPEELKLAVCEKAFRDSRIDTGQAIADVYGRCRSRLPESAIEILTWLATSHPDPEKELWDESIGQTPYYGGDPLSQGMNCARGRVALAICDLCSRDNEYLHRLRQPIESLLRDPSLCVRACAAAILRNLSVTDPSLSMELFQQMELSDDRLFATEHVSTFLSVIVQSNFAAVASVVERLLYSEAPEVRETASRLTGLAALAGNKVEALIANSNTHSPENRRGIAKIAAANAGDSLHRAWCEQQLRTLFNDPELVVRKEAASCFRSLRKLSLENYEDLIAAFESSLAFEEESEELLTALDRSTQRIPGLTLRICERRLKRLEQEKSNIRGRYREFDTEIGLVFRTYQQHMNDVFGVRALDLIDRLCLAGTFDARPKLNEFER